MASHMARNVLEYKSPEDGLSIDDFYKAQGYALLYKGLGKTVNEIPLEELTVTIFRHTYPREMINALKASGLTVEAAHPGVYSVTGAVSVPAQIVVSSRLPKGEYVPFKALAKNASVEDLLQVLQLADGSDPRMTDYIRAVLNVSLVLNEELIAEIKEAGIMPETVRKIFQEEFQKERAEGREEGREEGRYDRSREIYERLKAVNMPEEQARAIAFG